MIKLDYVTLGIVISIVGVVASFVMFTLWRIDNSEKGLSIWALASAIGAVGFLVLLFNPILGGYVTFLNNICTLSTPLLILEGIFQFKGYGRKKLRKITVPILIVFFIIISFINRNDITTRYLFHDAVLTVIFISCAYFLICDVNGQERKVYSITTAAFLVIGVGFMYRWYLAFKGEFNPPVGLKHPYMGVLFLIIILWLLGWTYGLTLAINYRAQQRIMKMAKEDDLTGLASRKFLNETMDNLIFQSKANGDKFLVLLLDLNGFKMINDTYGHAFGDQVLIIMAKAFKKVVRNHDLSARLGGDEFVCIINLNKSDSDIFAIKERLRTSIERLHVLNDYEVQLRTSIGYSIIPSDGLSVDKILDKADQRMYEEKICNRPMSKVVKKLKVEHI